MTTTKAYPMKHTAIFRGKRNSSKGKALIILNNFPDRYLTAKQIHDYTGVNLNYLQQRLTFWYKVKYVNRRVVISDKGRPCYAYQIATRGRTFVELRMPTDTRIRFISEINQWINDHGVKG